MSQFKTRQELLRAYADLLDRSEKAGIEPKHKFDGIIYSNSRNEPELMEFLRYELPVAIVEGRHVWIGDTIVVEHRRYTAQVDGWYKRGMNTLCDDVFHCLFNIGHEFHATLLPAVPKKKTVKIYGWLNKYDGATKTSLSDSIVTYEGDINKAKWVRYTKLDGEIGVEG